MITRCIVSIKQTNIPTQKTETKQLNKKKQPKLHCITQITLYFCMDNFRGQHCMIHHGDFDNTCFDQK